MDFSENRNESSSNPYGLLLHSLSLIPISHYVIGFLVVFFVFLYNFLEFHFFENLRTGLRGFPVVFTYNSSSDIYNAVVSKCRVLNGRYLPTPWISSPHFQTCFLNFFGRPPVFSYRRELFHASDGGTIALDWLSSSDGETRIVVPDDMPFVFWVHVFDFVTVSGAFHMNNVISKDDTTPIMVVIPGLTSDSASALIDVKSTCLSEVSDPLVKNFLYIKHLAFNTAKSGWNVVVTNHRGLGGVSITSDCFYNAGWTEDTRVIINHLHDEYPKAPLFLVGTSIGANILVKYLGEDGDDIPIAAAVAVCSPWDLLIGDRFICRRLVQKLYDRALTIGLQGYAQLHEPRYTRLANWEGIKKSRSIRDFDHHATCLVGKFETVDTYYRHCSSTNYVGNVSVPLLCISALDDPVCTREAIPWDECRANKNIVLATVKHGGHLAFFEGITAAGLWWVRAVDEFCRVMHSSQYMHVKKKNPIAQSKLSSIDQGPFVNVAADGMVAAMGHEQMRDDKVEELSESQKNHHGKAEILPDVEQHEQLTQPKPDSMADTAQTSSQATSNQDAKTLDVLAPVKRCLDLLSQQNRCSVWLLAYIAIVTSWPLLGSAFNIVFRKKLRNVSPSALLRR
ncbi:hypothetical protein FEM48_Zijuj06G0171100 [Ziziphus jujuba var. spinosa]|uniref:AB hydrolase-1 domain-containing protein n=1 Tax=Ziziphus jujuba var. spinosa TaxID=714518 RepID=A0A978VAJ1_ZIZJJ|nr:hypothetical protein FEM48_Zijuj06G0171100 [Ziziphus jujuba var. spinosa]